MKSIVAWAMAASAVLGAMPLAASAQYRDHDRDRRWQGDIRHFENRDLHQWRSGAWHHGSRGGQLGWWWVIGGMWYFYPQPVYPYPDPYRPPTVVIEQAPPPVIVQVPAPEPVQIVPSQPPAASQPAAQFWYYCEAARGYYPYVASCPSGWKTVPATPPGVQP